MKPDLGTRWVLLAAVAGLVMGGVLAYRKKRDARASLFAAYFNVEEPVLRR